MSNKMSLTTSTGVKSLVWQLNLLYTTHLPRPLRIEYENAFNHAMNRGRGRALTFHDKRFYLAFLETLSEVHSRFNCIIHAYCLMGNHYHYGVKVSSILKKTLGRQSNFEARKVAMYLC